MALGLYLPVWQLNLDPMRQYQFGSNSNKFIINSAKLKCAYLTAKYISDMVFSKEHR
jgi:hypothetical protein